MDQNWCKHLWAITKVIFSYAGSPQVKISQKVLGGWATSSTHTVHSEP